MSRVTFTEFVWIGQCAELGGQIHFQDFIIRINPFDIIRDLKTPLRKNMSLWSNDLLNQIIRGNDEAQDRKEEEEMKSSTFSLVLVSRRRISVDFEISELFEDNLKML